MGEKRTFSGAGDDLRSGGVLVEAVDDKRWGDLMERFINAHPDLWNEDIGAD